MGPAFVWWVSEERAENGDGHLFRNVCKIWVEYPFYVSG